jgi:hypothetical protein
MTDLNKPEDHTSGEGSPVKPASRPGGDAASSSDHGSDELPYIDDPVSKWWIGIIVAVFALIFAWAILFGGGGVFDGIFDSDDPTPSPEPTISASPAPSVEVTLEPSAEPEGTPAVEVTLEPSAEPEGTPAVEVTLEPSAAPTATATSEPTDVPSVEPTAAPTDVPAASQTPEASPTG